MKKLSVFCVLLTICTSLASCDEAIVVNPGNTTEVSDYTFSQTEATQTLQTDKPSTTYSPITTVPFPSIEKKEIHYKSAYTAGCPIEFIYVSDVEGIERYLAVCEEEEPYIPCAICRITLRDIDYTPIIPEGTAELPITVSIDQIFAKNAFFTEEEGNTVLVTNAQDCLWSMEDETVTISFFDYFIPVAEIGEQYLAVIAKIPTNDDYIIYGLSVPLPHGNQVNDEYFEEQYQRFGLGIYANDAYNYASRVIAREVLDKWFYPYLDAE